MKLVSRIAIALCLCSLMAFSWFSVLTMESSSEKQFKLLQEARALIADEIYVRAQPLLEVAVSMNDIYSNESEDELKIVYLELIHLSGYKNKYIALLEHQLEKENATVMQFSELAEFHLSTNNLVDALSIFREGVQRTGDIELNNRYESLRYAYKKERGLFEDVTSIFSGTIQVKQGGLWGIYTTSGKEIIPCEYEKISTYYNGSAIILHEDGQIFAVDGNSSKFYITREPMVDFGNLNDNRVTLVSESGLYLGNTTLEIAKTELDYIGMYSNHYAPAKMGDKWGIINRDAEWVIPCIYDGVKTDELGRAVAQGCVFVEEGGHIKLYKGESILATTYEDAKPFAENYAAVKNNGKWGFIDSSGNLVLNYQYDDALSFGEHLAAVEVNGKWGYISLTGDIVIEPIFEEVRSFSEGYAPVKTADGWTFIALVEQY